VTVTTAFKHNVVRTVIDLQELLSGKHPLSEVRLGEVLVEDQLISPEQLGTALSRQQKGKNRHLGQILMEMGLLSQDEVILALSKKLGIPRVHLRGFDLPAQMLSRVPADLAIQYNVVPLADINGKLVVAMENPLDQEVISALRFNTNANIEAVIADSDDIRLLLQKFYSKLEESEALEDLQVDAVGSSPAESAESLYLMEQEAQRRPIVRLVNAILVQAVTKSASDINIRPEKDRVNVLYRIDGKLQYARTISRSLLPAIVSRIKITGQMDISERRLPQDGHARMAWGNKSIDLRISVVPTVKGESVVIRILDKDAGLRPLDALGLRDPDYHLIRRLIAHPHGLFLVTGPTGSGKSTTLYAILDEVKKRNVHLLTVEDPVEYDMEGVEQVQISLVKGYTFAQALRQFLRHDPDVIMVGEIRDSETAQIANKAALTGHLVFSTLHTNDAVSTITRLTDMGVERYLLSSTLLGVMAQRLVRLNCPHCLVEEEVDHIIRARLDLQPHEKFYRGTGCESCNQMGYRGRATVCELLAVTPEIAQLINDGASMQKLQQKAMAQGMTPLGDNALALAREGRTSVEEIMAVQLESSDTLSTG
jgi:type IV pilus assembly protein PilB